MLGCSFYSLTPLIRARNEHLEKHVLIYGLNLNSSKAGSGQKIDLNIFQNNFDSNFLYAHDIFNKIFVKLLSMTIDSSNINI
jgi:hypothetical protein